MKIPFSVNTLVALFLFLPCMVSLFVDLPALLIPRLAILTDPVAEVVTVQSPSKVRDTNDLVWFNVERQEFIHSGDYLQTGRKGEIDLALIATQSVPSPGRFIVTSNSFLRISKVNGQFKISLRDGGFSTDLKEGLEIIIENGLISKKISIPQGKHIFRKSTDQILSMSQVPGEDSKTSAPENVIEPSPQETPMPTASSLAVPYPKQNAHLFYDQQSWTPIQIKKVCKSECELVLSLENQVIFKQVWPAGTQPLAKFEFLKFVKSGLTQIDWVLSDQETIRGSFFLAKFEPELVSESLKKGYPIEILE